MNDIDFLPANYVCRQTSRSNDNWLRGLFVAVLGLMAVGWVAQQRSLDELSKRRDRLREQAGALASQTDQGEQLRAELLRLENHSKLLSGLRTHVPPTRWLTAIASSLPAKACFTEIHSEIDDSDEAAPRQGQAPVASKPSTQSEMIRQDLDRLAKTTPHRTLTIMLRGCAADDLEVSTLLTSLHKLPLFDKVQLLYTDQLSAGHRNLRSFAIRLRTRSLSNRSSARPASAPVAATQLPKQN